MTEDVSQKDIRHFLKSFGIQADEAIMAHLARNPGTVPLRVRAVLEDLTDYRDRPPEKPLEVTIEGLIRR